MPGSPPNFAMRRATVALAALLVVGGGIGFALSLANRSGNESKMSGDGDRVVSSWDVVVLDDPLADVVTVYDATGTELSRVATALRGVLDVGVPGLVVLGAAGDPTADGLGVLDLATGTITTLEIGLPVVERLGTSPYLLASDSTTGALLLVDVARSRVIDLLDLAGDGAVVVPDTVRVSGSNEWVAFSDLRSGATVVVDLTGGAGGTGGPNATVLPGLLADLTDTRIATTTNRGATMLVDLYDTAGTRLGTTETVPLIAAMVVGDTGVVGVGADASVVRIDAAATSADVRDDLRQEVQRQLAGAATEQVEARSGQVAFNHRRLVVAGRGWSAIVDDTGNVVATNALGTASTSIGATAATQRCVVVFGSPSEPSTLFDTSTGAVIASFDPSVPVDASVDGCTVVRQGFGTAPGAWRGYRIVGPDLDVAPSDRVVALAPDGTAAIVSGAGTSLQRFGDEPTVPLSTSVSLGAFARRGG